MNECMSVGLGSQLGTNGGRGVGSSRASWQDPVYSFDVQISKQTHRLDNDLSRGGSENFK